MRNPFPQERADPRYHPDWPVAETGPLCSNRRLDALSAPAGRALSGAPGRVHRVLRRVSASTGSLTFRPLARTLARG